MGCMREKILRILLTAFAVMFVIYPISDGIVNLRVVFLFLLLLFLVLSIRNKLNKIKININENYYHWIVIVLAMITRVGIVLWLESDISQVSDFEGAITASRTLQFAGDYYRVFTHWVLYPTLMNVVYKVFGETQLVALLFNSVILTLCSVFVYNNASMLSKKKSCGLLAAILYIFWPANIFYTLIFTQEHICSLLLQIVIYVFLKSEDSDGLKFNCNKIISFLIVGVLLGISTFFKNFAPVFLIAFAIYYVLKGIREKELKVYIRYKLLTLALICFSFSITKNVIFNFLDDIVGVEVARNITACYLNVGLRDDGTYNADNYNMYFDTLRQNNYDYEKTNSQILEKLFQEEKKNLSLDFFKNKAKIVFGRDSSRVGVVSLSFAAKDHIYKAKILDEQIVEINDNYFTVLVFLTAMGLIPMVRKKDLKVFLMYLFFFGCLLLLLLVEAQNRYMYSIQTIMCILAAWGFSTVKEIYNIGKKKKLI